MTEREPAALDSTFRCTHFACLLAVRACIRRQTETKTVHINAKTKPVHEYCASGECEQGNVHRAAHPEFTYLPTDKRKPPRLDVVAAVEERTMPKGYPRGEACNTCGSTGTRHRAGCAEGAEEPRPPIATPKPGAAMEREAAPVAVVPAIPAPKPITEQTVDELVERRARLVAEQLQVDEELRRRRTAIDAALGAVGAAA